MITLEILKDLGIDPKDGLARCMNKEDFYFKMLKLGLSNEKFDSIEEVLRDKNMKEGFEMAHALKGVAGNLAIDPIYKPMSELTELLRNKKDGDYLGIYKPAKEMRDKLLKIINE
ncbi:MAG: Hpt domain-containing protein [Selenomonadaceae bacterium]|nr:Hpt domain-containing protein [Selenomonadaceae bacterium]